MSDADVSRRRRAPRINALLDGIPMMSVNLDQANDQHAQLAAEHAHGTAAMLRGFFEGQAAEPAVA